MRIELSDFAILGLVVPDSAISAVDYPITSEALPRSSSPANSITEIANRLVLASTSSRFILPIRNPQFPIPIHSAIRNPQFLPNPHSAIRNLFLQSAIP
jgi:hypothetical protein